MIGIIEIGVCGNGLTSLCTGTNRPTPVHRSRLVVRPVCFQPIYHFQYLRHLLGVDPYQLTSHRSVPLPECGEVAEVIEDTCDASWLDGADGGSKEPMIGVASFQGAVDKERAERSGHPRRPEKRSSSGSVVGTVDAARAKVSVPSMSAARSSGSRITMSSAGICVR